MMNTELDSATQVIAAEGAFRLRTWRTEDLDWYAQIVGDPQIMRFIGDGAIRGRDRAAREIEGFQREQSIRGWSRWVLERCDGTPLGLVGYSLRDGEVDWGARARRSAWGTRAVPAGAALATRAGLVDCGLDAVVAYTQVDNRRAWQFNSHLGFRETGRLTRQGRPVVRQVLDRDRFYREGYRERCDAMIMRFAHRTSQPEAAA